VVLGNLVGRGRINELWNQVKQLLFLDMNAGYHDMKVVGDEVALQTLTTNLDKSIMKSNILLVEEE